MVKIFLILKMLRSQLPLLVELVGFALVVIGVALLSHAVAFIVGGTGIIFAIERQPSGKP